MMHLNGLNWRGSTLKINFSKYQSIAMPKPGIEGVCLTRSLSLSLSPCVCVSRSRLILRS
jgi:hypothetical protein